MPDRARGTPLAAGAPRWPFATREEGHEWASLGRGRSQMGASGRPTVLHWTTSASPPATGKGIRRQGEPAHSLRYAGPGLLQGLSFACAMRGCGARALDAPRRRDPVSSSPPPDEFASLTPWAHSTPRSGAGAVQAAPEGRGVHGDRPIGRNIEEASPETPRAPRGPPTLVDHSLRAGVSSSAASMQRHLAPRGRSREEGGWRVQGRAQIQK